MVNSDAHKAKEESSFTLQTQTLKVIHQRPGFDRLADVLAAELGDLSAWEIQPLTGGGVSKHVYRMSRDEVTYFVKEIKDNERYTLQLLHQLGLRIAPQVVYPDMLGQHVLVSSFTDGQPIQQKKLDAGLIRNFAHMQNALNDRRLFRSGRPPSGCKYTDHDDGFFRNGMLSNIEGGYRNLLALRDLALPIVDRLIAVADRIRTNADRLASMYAEMPFAWQHHDFREGHILGNPQRLVDWGSSYGHGPFLFDLAPFFVDDVDGSGLYRQELEICRNISAGVFDVWMQGALAARFASFLTYRLCPGGGNVNNREQARRFLEYYN